MTEKTVGPDLSGLVQPQNLIRQYFVLFKVAGGPADQKWTPLRKGDHDGLLNKPELVEAVEFVKARRHVGGVILELDGRIYNIYVIEKPTLDPNCFSL